MTGSSRSREDDFNAYENITYVGCNVTINKIQIGHHAIVTSSPIVAGTVERSFNRVQESKAGPELKALLAELHATVALLCEHLPTEQQKVDATEALETLAKEATRDEPRKKWYDVSAEGLMAAANAVADIGPKVIGIVKAIGAVLAFS